MNSVSREPQLPQRHFISIRGTWPRPAATNAARSASFAWRHDFAPDMHPEACASHRARRRQLVRICPDLRHQRPSTTTGLRAGRPVGAAGRRAAFTVPSITVVAPARLTFTNGTVLAAACSAIGSQPVTSWLGLRTRGESACCHVGRCQLAQAQSGSADRFGRVACHGVLRLAYSCTVGISHMTKRSVIRPGRNPISRPSQLVRCNITEPPAKRELQPLERD
jgi:hypothetical protein